MANFKRKKPKNSRSGCLMCKPHKMNGAKDKDRHSVIVARDTPQDEDGKFTQALLEADAAMIEERKK